MVWQREVLVENYRDVHERTSCAPAGRARKIWVGPDGTRTGPVISYRTVSEASSGTSGSAFGSRTRETPISAPGYGGSSCSKDAGKWDASWTTPDPKFTPSTKGQEEKKSSNYGEYESKCDYPEGQNWRLADTTKPLEKQLAEELAVLEAAKSDAVRKLT
ncbi:hypothetical protein FOZ61_000880 [Perkinsus olseni]|uniref:Uncharacterized protein n=1 Tax=Perkinsus olseni TaxID=32597 RepID=A0A7J6KT77_PEROL|nr:hypothetical protein FOZ61_000880 [Perkinsus olseni]KAF4650378.1 hypothetical protein FOL46_001003 [Perkinsus olseni]